MKYIEVRIDASPLGIELLSAGLAGLGIDDIEIDDPRDAEERLANALPSEYCDDETRAAELSKEQSVVFYAEYGADGEKLVRRAVSMTEKIRRSVSAGDFGPDADAGTLNVKTAVRDDGEWKDKWKEFFRPTAVTDRITVRPGWEEYDPVKEDEIVISIDPGMAFGTGLHETTSLAAALLEKYISPGMKVLDVGCGTGILSIIAAKLGASEVLGTDIDADAVRTAAANFSENGVSGVCRAEEADLAGGVDICADIVVANLLAGLVEELSADVQGCIRRGGVYIVSGILGTQKDEIEKCLSDCGFEVIEWRDDGEWSAAAAGFLPAQTYI
jgi:ribosomal protein L11 methyltransferase